MSHCEIADSVNLDFNGKPTLGRAAGFLHRPLADFDDIGSAGLLIRNLTDDGKAAPGRNGVAECHRADIKNASLGP